MECNCQDWKENIDELNGPLLLQHARNPQLDNDYKGKVFIYCPWCGAILQPTEKGAQMKWIPVNEGLPEVRLNVLTYLKANWKGSNHNDDWMRTQNVRNSDKKWSDRDGENRYYEVTH